MTNKDILKKTNFITEVVTTVICAIAFLVAPVLLTVKKTNFWTCSLAAILFVVGLWAIYNIITKIKIIRKIKKGDCKYISGKIEVIEPCSNIIPGRADYLKVVVGGNTFFINKISNYNYKTGNEIEAVFVSNQNVPVYMSRLWHISENDNSITENKDKGFVMVLLPIFIVLVIVIISIIVKLVS